MLKQDQLERERSSCGQEGAVHTREERIRILRDELEAIPQATISELIRSMRNRCVETVAADVNMVKLHPCDFPFAPCSV